MKKFLLLLLQKERTWWRMLVVGLVVDLTCPSSRLLEEDGMASWEYLTAFLSFGPFFRDTQTQACLSGPSERDDAGRRRTPVF